eukprot:TRINITY_DN38118_c0_g1_i1.p2 TRINITY_DN38118_c0_g1~~TRINITY_DN38118_c0_g1_i1.p2  ORF type:complete len:173 (+),score=57.46 TRINITY_DN38118_c0_g1_i1:67-585(+)
MIQRPPRSTQGVSSAASDVYKRQIGYMGYDTVALFEKKLKFKNKDILNIPIIRFNLYNRYICYDHFTHKVFVIDNIFKDNKRSYDEIINTQKQYILSLLNKTANIEEIKEKGDIDIEFCTSKKKKKKKKKKNFWVETLYIKKKKNRNKNTKKKSYVENANKKKIQKKKMIRK